MMNKPGGFLHVNVNEPVEIKTEPVNDEDVQEIVPHVNKPVTKLTPKVGIHQGNVQFSDVIANDNSNILLVKDNSQRLLSKTLLNINGKLYFIERIPQTTDSQKQIEEVIVSQPKDFNRVKAVSAKCQYCDKILKHSQNLKRHIKKCLNSPTYSCVNCFYQTTSEHSWILHTSKCGKYTPEKTKTIKSSRIITKDNFLSSCLVCNISTPRHSDKCSGCGSMTKWKCKNCYRNFSSLKTARDHYRRKCKPESYFYCLRCDYKSAERYRTEQHIVKIHHESENISKFIQQRKVSVDSNVVVHACSLCGRIFNDASHLNRHSSFCRKEAFSVLSSSEEINTDEDVSRADSTLQPEETNATQLIVLSCLKCDKDIRLGQHVDVTTETSCSDCSFTLIYKCKTCGAVSPLYEPLAHHVKIMCSPEKPIEIKCAECDYVTDCKDQLNEHEKIVHGDISATCTNCGTFFTNSDYFIEHVNRCGIVDTLPNDEGPLKTSAEASLNHDMSLNRDISISSISDNSAVKQVNKEADQEMRGNSLRSPAKSPDKSPAKRKKTEEDKPVIENKIIKPIEMKIAKVLHLCHYCSYESQTKNDLEKHLKIHVKKTKKSKLRGRKKSLMKTVKSKFAGDKKLNLPCTVMLTRL